MIEFGGAALGSIVRTAGAFGEMTQITLRLLPRVAPSVRKIYVSSAKASGWSSLRSGIAASVAAGCT